MAKVINALKRGFSYRHATGGRGALGLYTDGLLVAEYENYLGNDEPVTIYGKSLTNVDQWFNEESATKNYAIGTKMEVEDMVFRYAHVNADSDSVWRGRGTLNLGKNAKVYTGHNYISAMTAASAAAETVTVTLTEDATADEFENGWMALFPSVWTGIVTGRVKRNDATSTTTKLYLKEGIQAACGAASTGRLHWNQYAYVGKPFTSADVTPGFSAVVGCAWVNCTADYYLWVQTWGPYMCQYSETEKPGQGRYHRSVYFDSYGGFLNPATESIYNETTGDAQLAGFSLPCALNSTDEGSGWSPWVMLQISP